MRPLPALLSVALHVVLVLVALRIDRAPPSARSETSPIEIDFLEQQPRAEQGDAPGVQVVEAAPPPAVSARPKRSRKAERPGKAVAPKQEQRAEAPPPLEPSPPASKAAAEPAAEPAPLRSVLPGAPLAFAPGGGLPVAGDLELSLSPSARVGERLGATGLEGANAGITVRPGDGGPDAGFAAMEERMAVERHVAEVVGVAKARDRVEKGLVDDHFVEMRRSIDKALESPPLIEEARNPVGAFMRTYSAGMERFGRSGNPYAQGEADGPELRAAEIAGPTAGSPEVAAQRAMARHYHDTRMGKFASELVAIISVRQTREGTPEVRLVESSGAPEFDAIALDAIPDAVATLSPPSTGLGIHPWGTHSVWAIVGRIIKPELNLLPPIPGSLGLGLGAGGVFDPALPAPESRQPGDVRFEVRARLLEVH